MKKNCLFAILLGLILITTNVSLAHHGPSHRPPGGHGHSMHHSHHGHHRPMMHRPHHHYHPPVRSYYYSSYYGPYYPYYGGLNINYSRPRPIYYHGGLGASFHISI